jgi:hypothetical protein
MSKAIFVSRIRFSQKADSVASWMGGITASAVKLKASFNRKLVEPDL